MLSQTCIHIWLLQCYLEFAMHIILETMLFFTIVLCWKRLFKCMAGGWSIPRMLDDWFSAPWWVMDGYAKDSIHLMPNFPEESNEPLVAHLNVKAKAEFVRLYTIVTIIVIYISTFCMYTEMLLWPSKECITLLHSGHILYRTPETLIVACKVHLYVKPWL